MRKVEFTLRIIISSCHKCSSRGRYVGVRDVGPVLLDLLLISRLSRNFWTKEIIREREKRKYSLINNQRKRKGFGWKKFEDST